jgi:hypothetical protein
LANVSTSLSVGLLTPSDRVPFSRELGILKGLEYKEAERLVTDIVSKLKDPSMTPHQVRIIVEWFAPSMKQAPGA